MSAGRTTGVRVRYLFDEAVAGVMQRPGRALLTALGTALGVGSFVAVTGITTTANSQITGQFNSITSTRVEVRHAATDAEEHLIFPADADRRIARINGVEASALTWDLDQTIVSRFPKNVAGGQSDSARAVAVSDGYWELSKARFSRGRPFAGFLSTQPVAVVGRAVADQLNIRSLDEPNGIFLDGSPFTVIGVIDDQPGVQTASGTEVLVPAEVALKLWGDPVAPATVEIRTALGAASQVQRQVAVALDPFKPAQFVTSAAAQPIVLRDRISDELQRLFLAISAFCLFVGAIGIFNISLLSVLGRVPEIGLRRAVGASRRQVAAQFMMESTILGAFGGALGALAGTVALFVTASVRNWTPVLPVWLLFSAPAVGVLVGAAAGAYPALRAARIEAVAAFRA